MLLSYLSISLSVCWAKEAYSSCRTISHQNDTDLISLDGLDSPVVKIVSQLAITGLEEKVFLD